MEQKKTKKPTKKARKDSRIRNVHEIRNGTLPQGYEHYIFVSYSRSGNIPEWLQNHFVPVLRKCMATLMPDEPALFVDEEIDPGSDWPDTLANALHKSCCMVAIWTPRYFRSKWCIAEWKTMMHREKQLGLRTSDNPKGIVYPIIYADGTSFPDEAKRTQYRRDFKQFAYPYEVFKHSERYLHFHDQVSNMAEELVERMKTVPKWDSSWESVRPDTEPPFPPKFRRL